ncbi:MAG TPA: copper transporter [Thermoleophilaceae bacterium]|jgi:hypothetical protein|nr:copper transporter [Thermoleophilaceae bacterium]
MLDFRYHALSLVAVFLALAIGIVLGVTIGNSLVSDAERSLRGNLRADVEKAHSDAARAQSDVAGRDRMLDQLYPGLVASRLAGERVAVVSWGQLPGNVESGVRDAVGKGGGHIDSISVLDKPLSTLKQTVGADVFSSQTADQESLKALGRSLARSIISGDQFAHALQGSFPDNFSGQFKRADAIAFYEAPKPTDGSDADGVKERDDDRAKTIESAMIDELVKHTIAVVGVEATNTDPSQIPRYESLKLTGTSDSVDVSGGRIAAVFALAGAKGNFGLKSTADQPLPDEALTVAP